MNGSPAMAQAALLPYGTLLSGRYAVGKAEAQTEKEAVYSGYDRHAERAVSVHEFLPAPLAVREDSEKAVSPADAESASAFFRGAESFHAYARALTEAVGAAGLMNVRDAFFENGTAYYVADAVGGVTLAEFLRVRGARLSMGEVLTLFDALSGGLLVLHSLRLTHGAISPMHVFLPEMGLPTPVAPMLVSFALPEAGGADAAKDAAERRDIRLLGQTLYLAYTGRSAPEPAARDAFSPLGEPLASLFFSMLTKDDRRCYHSVFDLLHTLGGIDFARTPIVVDPALFAAYRRQQAARAAKRQRAAAGRKLLIFGLFALLLLLAAGAAFLILKLR